MKKRIVATTSLLGLLFGLGIAAPTPALAACQNPLAFTQVNPGVGETGMRVTMTLGVSHAPTVPGPTHTSHWMGIEKNVLSGWYLVQAGYAIDGPEPLNHYSFFYEFTSDTEGDTGAVNVTPSWYDSSRPDNYKGDQVFFYMWYSTTTRWGLEIKDLTKGLDYSRYIYPPSGKDASHWIQTWSILATEQDECLLFQPLYNDAVQTFKQPQYIINGNWLWFTDCFCTQQSGPLYDGDGDNHILETAGIVDSNQYAYHTWVQHD